MLEETVAALNPQPAATFVDGTLGMGGHAEALLEQLGPDGTLIGIERDAEMLEQARSRLARFGSAFRGVHARFSSLGDVVRGARAEPVDGILLDLGMCSAQLDDPKRGLSFRDDARSAPLDMRLDRSRGETAAQLIARCDEAELETLLRGGGVSTPRRVAHALATHRPLETVGDLLDALRDVRLPRRRHHPATLVFQALRMAVNDEIQELESALETSVELLAPGGRLAVLSYHSGEDRRVKGFFAREVRGCICPPDLPQCGCGRRVRIAHVVRGQAPSDTEQRRNPRARSARLRAGERV
jgi:16S rRNA (cytosine1402-N4)-methyltransferase